MNGHAPEELIPVFAILDEISEGINEILQNSDKFFDPNVYDSETKAKVEEGWDAQHKAIQRLKRDLEEVLDGNDNLIADLGAVGLTGPIGEAKRRVLEKLRKWLKKAGKQARWIKLAKSVLKSLSKVLDNVPALGLIVEAIGEFLDLIDALFSKKQ